MYNTDTPLRAELPTSRQLARSTLVAAISAAVILVVVVMPAEYGIDPTGIGSVLRLTEMGRIKKQLAAEAAADAAAPQAKATPEPRQIAPTTVPTAAAMPAAAVTTKTAEKWRDEIPFTLPPGQGIEIKLSMGKAESSISTHTATVAAGQSATKRAAVLRLMKVYSKPRLMAITAGSGATAASQT